MSITDLNAFDPSFAAPADWAMFYRSLGFQVVPSRDPVAGRPWKVPAFGWKEFSSGDLVAQPIFDKWFGVNGTYSAKPNMGVLTGRVSGVFILDLDDHKTDAAQVWWRALMAEHNNDMEIETAQQVTGGGGRQLLFRAPAGWLAPTNAMSALGVDIRGEGGFAVLPPSRHSSGRNYAWKPGAAPWEMEIADAPQWLCEAIDTLVARHGSKPDGERTLAQHTPSPGTDFNPFGQRIDGRDEYMRDLIWATLLEWRSECPFPPDTKSNRDKMFDTFDKYARKTKSRLAGDGSNEDKLELEGRGITLFSEKWAYALRKWDTDIAADAARKVEREAVVVAPRPVDPATGEEMPLLLSAAQFISSFTPPEYLIDGIMQRGYLYSLTARTGHGKTAVDMYISQTIARSQPMHGKEVLPGTVLFLAGENPDDIRARFLVLADEYKFDVNDIKIRFIDGVVDVAASLQRIQAEAATIPDLRLVIVDTAAAYFNGDDTNNNSQQGAYARLLRQLTFLPGKPAVLVNCHPIKNASRDNLLPMGGSAFLNEIDGNLTLWANADRQTTLHWLGKFRGPEFEPITFEMETVTSPKVMDAKGRLMPSVVARPVSEIKMQFAEGKQEREEINLLNFIAANKNASISDLAIKCNFISGAGNPQKSKVHGMCGRLVEEKLLERRGQKYRITTKGKKEINWEGEND